MDHKKTAIIIGGGIGGLATACILAKAGYAVELFEKNDRLGGRANLLKKDGFTFDMGPSWYLMPEVFEQFYALLGEKVEDHLDLVKLDPSYRIYFKEDDSSVDIYGDLERDLPIIEELETGGAEQMKKYLKRAQYQYEVSLDRFLYKNYDSIFDFFTWEVMKDGLRLSVFTKMDNYVRRFFNSQKVQKILQYPLVFLGSSPYNTPALYSLMSHVDFNQGVFYPMGGIYTFIESMKTIAEKHGAVLHTGADVKAILTEDDVAMGIQLANGDIVEADIVISNADIQHTETQLLEKRLQDHTDTYWEKRTLAPSAFLMYLGFNRKLKGLKHHTLVFSEDWKKNFDEIFDDPKWPSDPSFYVCAPGQTDPSVAPEGKENLFILVPIAAGLEYSDEELHAYGDKILKTLEEQIGEKDLASAIEVKELFCVKDFDKQYNSFKGTALGLAHTLEQTAIFRPNNVSKKVKGLYYVGGNTNPGIGMPMCLISAQLLYKRLTGDRSNKALQSLNHESPE